MRLLSIASSIILLLGSVINASAADRFQLVKTDDGITVNLDGKLFTKYVNKSGSKPILYPVIGPTGEPITRSYPIEDALPAERRDHVHHRSLWFTHGIVNDSDFWAEGQSNCGTIEHTEFVKVEGGERGVIVAKSRWLDRNGKHICDDLRELTLGTDGDSRYIDFDIQITAKDAPVTFGDTKEGSFGIRVAGTMKVDTENGGTIINEHGDKDKNAWGKQASWVDYFGPIGDSTVGVAILNHPKSFRYPTYWHVRTYGLFAANPFGLHDFKGDKTIDASHTLKPGESMKLCYRVLIHSGDQDQGNVAAAWETYKKIEK